MSLKSLSKKITPILATVWWRYENEGTAGFHIWMTEWSRAHVSAVASLTFRLGFHRLLYYQTDFYYSPAYWCTLENVCLYRWIGMSSSKSSPLNWISTDSESQEPMIDFPSIRGNSIKVIFSLCANFIQIIPLYELSTNYSSGERGQIETKSFPVKYFFVLLTHIVLYRYLIYK